MSSPSVVIAGAGPAGLVTGLELAARGVPVRVIEAGSRISEDTTTHLIWFGNAVRELHRISDVFDPARQRPITGVYTHANRIVNALRDAADAAGLAVSYDHKVTSVRPSKTDVQAVIDRGGQREEMSADFLVDGDIAGRLDYIAASGANQAILDGVTAARGISGCSRTLATKRKS
jgi:2-polyprenyl-6-methoxyphenol hydroxylase-like FAD-dependent oxidoreductase